MEQTSIILLTTKEAAEYLRISLVTLSRYINHLSDPIPVYRFSRNNVRINKAELDAWIKRNRK